jgi:UDP-N-acetylglucosamine acyltransferase
MIHSTAIISEKAKIGKNAEIGPNVVIYDDVVIGDNVVIHPNVVIYDGARIGDNCKFFPGAVISAPPQDLKYANEPTKVIIGNNNDIREYVTIHRGTVATGKTTLGDNNLIMAYCHIAHDCHLGSNIVMANTTQLAGHVSIDDWVVIGGVVKITQFCTIGKHTMLGADAKITKDVSHYCLLGRIPAQIEGINKVGLSRRGFSQEKIREIQNFYNIVLFSGYNNKDGIEKYVQSYQVSPEIQECIDFIQNSKRGILR